MGKTALRRLPGGPYPAFLTTGIAKSRFFWHKDVGNNTDDQGGSGFRYDRV
jgi:hypothetical protein